jgi:hypothetical protein
LRSMLYARKISFVQEHRGGRVMLDKLVMDEYIEKNTIPSDT